MQSVLIVDDEKHTRDGLVAVLSDDYDVLAASNADEAVRLLDAEEFDAVVTDFRMAGKSGLSVIDKAISLPSKPACIMLTAYGNVETAGRRTFCQNPWTWTGSKRFWRRR